jgi:hypothetical protein
MKAIRFLIPALVGLIGLAAPAVQASGEFTGDVKYACEALLCLSSGVRPGECNPSLRRYFSITHKDPGKEIRKRKNFLGLCPAASESPEMRSLTNAIANGAGRCDAAYLNRALRRSVTAYSCKPLTFGRYQPAKIYATQQPGMSCTQTRISVIDNRLPAYCVQYSNHEYTYQTGVTYVGERLSGGRWVEQN